MRILASRSRLGSGGPRPSNGLFLAATLLLLGLGGCRPGTGNRASEPGDSASTASRAADSAAVLKTPASQEVPDDTGTAAYTAPAQEERASAPADPLDSLRARVDRLESENDSLRAAVGVLLTAPRPRDPGTRPETAGAQSDSAVGIVAEAGEVLTVDGEQVRSWGLRIVVSLVFLLMVGILVRASTWILERLAERSAKRRLFFKRLVPVFRIFIWTLAILFTALSSFEWIPRDSWPRGPRWGWPWGLPLRTS